MNNTARGMCVHAGAGSGKTTMLVAQYLKVLETLQDDPARIVAITFTEKAAAEMKSRIHAALDSQGHDSSRLSGARISTIHGFCTGLLRQFPVEASLDPDFRVLDQVQADMLLAKTIRAHWSDMLTAKDTRLMACMEIFPAETLLDMLEDLVLDRANLQRLDTRLRAVQRQDLLAARALARAAHPQDKDLASIEWGKADEEALAAGPLLLDLAQAFTGAFDQAKARIRHLDFEDLQIRTLRLLDITRVREKVARDIAYLLVDEFQDTNELQRQIIYHLAPLSSLFIVGDPKQSIYRFRGADVSVFRSVEQDMKAHGEHRILDANYRSVPGILSLCNGLFSRLMLPSQRPYEIPHQPLKPQRADTSGTPCIDAWQHRIGEKEKPPVDTLRRREAAHIAASLRQNPPQHWKDVAILFRSMGKVYLYERELARHGIPYTTSSASAFFNQQCLTDLLNAIMVADDGTDDLAMMGFLRGPMVGISDEILWRLRGTTSLEESAARSDNPLLQQAITWLGNWRTIAHRDAPGALLAQIIRDTDFEALVLSQYLGLRKRALLRKIVELAERFKPQDGFTLKDFIAYLKTLVLEERRESEGPSAQETDTVSLLTVHKAKGLEFPVVILADMGHRKNTSYPRVIVHEDYGLGLKWRDENDQPVPTVQRLLAQYEEDRKEEAEAKRILYVACTRARDKLIFSGLNPQRSRTNPWNHWVLDYLQPTTFIEPAGPPITGSFSSPIATSALSPPFTASSLPSPFAASPLPSPFGASPIPPPFATSPIPSPFGRGQGEGSEISFALTDIVLPSSAPSRLTVTAIQDLLASKKARIASSGSKDAGPRDISPSLVGTLTHRILSRWDLKNPKDLARILDATLKEATLDGIMPEDTRKTIQQWLEGFALSPTGKNLTAANITRKEIPFVLPLGETIIEGTIDHLYQDASGAWALLDYKTDALASSDAIAERVQNYQTQLKLYGAACLQILKIDAIRIELYFLAPGIHHVEIFTAKDCASFMASLQERLCSAIVSASAP